MAATCRFAFAVHVLAMLAYKRGSDLSSDLLAASVNTNAVCIRRLLSDLRKAGLVSTQQGTGGGARLVGDPEEITLDAIYRAVEQGKTFSPHPHEPNHECPVGRKIQMVLGEVFSSAQRALEEALAQRTLADVLETVIEETPRVRRAARSTPPAIAGAR